MYINPIIIGALGTLLVEFLGLTVYITVSVIRTNRRVNKELNKK